MTSREWKAVHNWAAITLALAASVFVVALAIGAAVRLSVPGIRRAMVAADDRLAAEIVRDRTMPAEE